MPAISLSANSILRLLVNAAASLQVTHKGIRPSNKKTPRFIKTLCLEVGCEEMQGYGYAPPMSARELED
jgi:EAL domain-containing protein (putative c-di-GMP-specific phosphodiesterase class I)